MAKKAHPDYLDRCPDCIPLPQLFPSSCVAPLLAALRGEMDDPKCTLHCGITLLAWGANLWIGDHDHPVKAARDAVLAGDTCTPEECVAAADELEKLLALKAGGPDELKAAIDWRAALRAVLTLLLGLL